MSREERTTHRKGEGRARRVPLGANQLKLARKARPGMVGRWVNDTPGRIQRALQAGYEHVFESTDQDGEEKPVSTIVGVTEGGHPLVGYYMEIPKEFYDEDQLAKQEQVDSVEDAIRLGNIEGQVGQDGRYVPEDGIKVDTKVGKK